MQLRHSTKGGPSYPNHPIMKGLLIGSSITAAFLLGGCASGKDEGKRSDATKIEAMSPPTVLAPQKAPPDSDGDGVPDASDKCPKVKGSSHAQGCPEKKPQPVRLLGEIAPVSPGRKSMSTPPPPDTDGDGVPDNMDRCPRVKGPKSNRGCPPPLPGGPRRIYPPPMLPTPAK